jgi:cyanate permease
MGRDKTDETTRRLMRLERKIDAIWTTCQAVATAIFAGFAFWLVWYRWGWSDGSAVGAIFAAVTFANWVFQRERDRI